MNEWRLTADGDGLVGIGDLRRAGLAVKDVSALVRRRELTRLDRGWYALTTPQTQQTLQQRHVLQTKAMLRSHEGRAVAGHHSALLLLGLPTLGADLGVVRLSRLTPGCPRTRATLRLGRVVPAEAVRPPTVAPYLAVVQHGISAGPLSALVAADAALHRGLVTPDELRDAVTLARHHPHSGKISSILALADGRRESPGETRTAYAFHLLGVDVTPQVEIRSGTFRAVVDFTVDGAKVVVEFDGRVKYSRGVDEVDPFGRAEPASEVLWAEKQREDGLRALGYEVVRVTWADLADLAALGRRIGEAVARARARAA